MSLKRIKTWPISLLNDWPEDFTPDTLLFSDLHIHERKDFRITDKNGLNSRLNEGLNIIDQITDVAKKFNIWRIFFLGDLFHLHDRIPNHVIQETDKHLQKLLQVAEEFTHIEGNHDFLLEEYPTPVILADSEQYFFENGVGWVDDDNLTFWMIPFYRDFKVFRSKLEEVCSEIEGPSIVLFHQDVPGAVYSSDISVTAQPGWQPDLPDEVIFLGGHIHRAQQVGRFRFLGSPYQVNFGEEDEQKFIYLLDSKTKIIRPFELEYPKFVTLSLEEFKESSTQDLEKKVVGNYVRVADKLEKSALLNLDRRAITNELRKMGAKGCSTKFEIISIKQKKIDEKIREDHDKVRDNYVDTAETVLNKPKLKRIGQENWKKAETK